MSFNFPASHALSASSPCRQCPPTLRRCMPRLPTTAELTASDALEAARIQMRSEAARNECVEHGERVRRLVARHHVPRVVDAEEREAVRRLQRARRLAVHLPHLGRGRVEVAAVRPRQRLRPRLVAEPVADVVLVAGVDEHADAVVELVGELLLVRLHPVAGELEHECHLAVAVRPAVRADAERRAHLRAVEVSAHVGEVVAERRLLALLAHVVRVLAGESVRDEQPRVAHLGGDDARGRDRLARLDRRDARGRGHLHRRVRQLAHRRRVVIGRDRHVLVVAVLDERVGEAVADGRPLQPDRDRPLRQRAVIPPDLVRHCGDVMAGVALAHHEEVERGEGGVRLEELLDEVVHVGGDRRLVVVEPAAVREARPRGLVDVQKVRLRVPAVRVGDGGAAVGADGARAVLAEERDLGGAAGAAGHPHHHRVGRGRGARGEEPIEVMLVAGGELEVAGVLGDAVADRGGGGLGDLLQRASARRLGGREGHRCRQAEGQHRTHRRVY
mmetsp:Transcript_24049/g.59779  ORF Transcript_24049/g.59779 Transcript_24049/m.59779 type:complete len:502 (+) Transcript_24049:106-1611(+)